MSGNFNGICFIVALFTKKLKPRLQNPFPFFYGTFLDRYPSIIHPVHLPVHYTGRQIKGQQNMNYYSCYVDISHQSCYHKYEDLFMFIIPSERRNENGFLDISRETLYNPGIYRRKDT